MCIAVTRDMDLAPIWGRCLSELHYFVSMHQEVCQSVWMVIPLSSTPYEREIHISRHGYTHLYSQASSSQAVVEALQLYSTLQHSTALQLYSALQYTSSTIPLRPDTYRDISKRTHDDVGARTAAVTGISRDSLLEKT